MDAEIEDPAGETETPGLEFPIVGIGASAGGLEAVKDMLAEAGSAPGMAFVLVQHLDPNHESMMAELIAKRTELTVRQIRQDEPVKEDHVYVIPPGFALAIREGRLILSKFSEPRGMRRPIDEFFISLAKYQGANAACVVLSGTGADGSSGLRAIKDHGGLCVAQDPETARYDGMPTSAIATGLADFVLPPERIVSRIRTFFEHKKAKPTRADAATVADLLEDICGSIRTVVGHDFSGYKQSTLVRRIERRMQVLGVSDAAQYLERIGDDDEECTAIFKDLLINVTSFFRDAQYFDVLDAEAIRPLVRRRDSRQELRVWTPGCSSGEEAYSIAMLIADAFRTSAYRPLVQFFATDIDERMLAQAREAIYPLSAIKDIPEHLRERYTIGLDGQFQIAPQIRDIVRFSNHSVIKDPPFSRLDLISCRNLLIYMGEKIQSSLLPLFHYALKPGGFLFLGSSEGLSRREDLFSVVDQKARLFQRKEGGVAYPIDLPIGVDKAGKRRALKFGGRQNQGGMNVERNLAQQYVLERYAPPHVQLDSHGEVISSYGGLAKYIQFPQGGPSFNLMSLARRGLREALSALMRESRAKQGRAVLSDVEVSSEFGVQKVDLVADPLADGTTLILFNEREAFQQSLASDVIEPGEPRDRVYELEEELRQTRFRLRSTVEELETANEELKSSNEEMMSMNEELQSANEELSTVNEELKNKVDELNLLNDDLNNFLAATQLAVLIVDSHLRVRAFTDEARALFPIREADRGQLLSEIGSRLEDRDLIKDIQNVLAEGGEVERLINDADRGDYYNLRIVPYTSSNEEIEGAMITLANVTRLKTLELEHLENSQRLELALGIGGLGVWEYDPKAKRLILDEELFENLGAAPLDVVSAREFAQNIHPKDRIEFREALDEAVDGGGEFNMAFRLLRVDDKPAWLKAIGRVVDSKADRRMVGVMYDVSLEVEAGETRELLLREMSHRVKNLFAVISSMLTLASTEDMTADELASSIRGRILSLARAHEVTQGARNAEDIRLSDLLRSILSAHAEDNAFKLDGPEISIKARMITPLGLILHEFATNSVKYGSLSKEGGLVKLAWTDYQEEERQRIDLIWRERGGPPVAADAGVKAGFGSKLVELSAQQLNGEVKRRWKEDGLEAIITLRQKTETS